MMKVNKERNVCPAAVRAIRHAWVSSRCVCRIIILLLQLAHDEIQMLLLALTQRAEMKPAGSHAYDQSGCCHAFLCFLCL